MELTKALTHYVIIYDEIATAVLRGFA